MNVQRVLGLGCAAALAVIVIVSLALWGIVGLTTSPTHRQLEKIPEDIPPQAPAEVPDIDVHGEGRTSDKLKYWSEDIAEQTEIPGQALRAYGNAELIARDAWPECHLRWNTLAGIGWVETRHGTYSGNRLHPPHLNDAGVAEPKIIGIPLDGDNGTQRIEDTDDGVFDEDTEFDRAVGPLQFISASWDQFGLDANGDGVADPHQIDDAALSSAKLLCSGERDLSDEDDWADAIFAYNHSSDYLQRVAGAANSYAIGQPAVS